MRLRVRLVAEASTAESLQPLVESLLLAGLLADLSRGDEIFECTRVLQCISNHVTQLKELAAEVLRLQSCDRLVDPLKCALRIALI